jgi:hypothetical protein
MVTGLVTVLLMGITALVISLRDGDEARGTADATTAVDRAPTVTPMPAITWSVVGGVRLPTSRTHGPRNDSDGLASGFSNSEPGAALAAVHLLIRTGPTVGPSVFEPTIAGQATGANVAALELTTNELYTEAGAQPFATATGTELVGYRVGSYAGSPGSAAVDVILTSPALRQSGRSLQTTVSLEWINGDWWIVAPPLGDWGQVSTPIGELPDGLQRYEDIG